MNDEFNFSSSIQHRIASLLTEHGDEFARAYKNAQPYPHIVIDNFLPEEIVSKLLHDFPSPDSPSWVRLPTEDQKGKSSLAEDISLPASIRTAIHELNSKTFVHFLEKVTGISPIIPDPMMDGGGLHMIGNGGKLSVHVDFSHHPRTKLNRRLNLLLYLNRDWKEDYNGLFEFWDSEIKQPLKKIMPVFNRCVIFSTSAESYHGHPEPLKVPEGCYRRSIALYYFSNGREDQKDIQHNTIFRSRPGDQTYVSNTIIRFLSSGFFRSLIPPIIYGPMRSMYLSMFGTGEKK